MLERKKTKNKNSYYFKGRTATAVVYGYGYHKLAIITKGWTDYTEIKNSPFTEEGMEEVIASVRASLDD